MPETTDLLAEVKRLRQEQEDQGEIIAGLLRHSGRQTKTEIMAAIAADATLAEILMMVDGVRTQGEILADLQARALPNSSAMSVSRRFRRLSEEFHLIAPVDRTGAGVVYRKTKFDQTLGVSRDLERTRRG